MPKTKKKIKSRIKMNFNLHEHCEPPLNIKFLGAAVHEEIRGETWGLGSFTIGWDWGLGLFYY